MQYVLAVLAGIAACAGYKGWSLYTVLPIGAAFTAWILLYFGTQGMRVAAGGPLAYLLRVSAINIVQALALYGAGFGIHYLIG